MSDVLNYASYLCAGAVILVANELSASDRQDGLDSLLYAQTVASHKFADSADFQSWINASRMAMKTLGGTLFSEPSISFPAPAAGSFTLVDLAQQAMSQLVSPAAGQALKAKLEVLSQRASVFPESALLHTLAVQKERWALFKFGVMSAGVRTGFGALSFEFDDSVVGNILNHRFSHEKVIGNVAIGGYKAMVEREDFDLSRATIISLLGARREQQIIKLS